MKKKGSRAEVYHGNALQTAGGLKKKGLFKDKHGCIKSKKASNRAKTNKNLGKLQKQKGSGCFDYKKTVKTQLGGGKNKKNVELDKHIFIFSKGLETFTLPNNKYGNAKLNYNCNCPMKKLVKHKVADHVEGKVPVVKSKKSKKGGGFGAFVKLTSTLASKGAKLGSKAAEAAKKVDLDKALNKIDQASTAIEEVQQSVEQAQKQGQQLVTQGQQLATQGVQLGNQISTKQKKVAKEYKRINIFPKRHGKLRTIN